MSIHGLYKADAEDSDTAAEMARALRRVGYFVADPADAQFTCDAIESAAKGPSRAYAAVCKNILAKQKSDR